MRNHVSSNGIEGTTAYENILTYARRSFLGAVVFIPNGYDRKEVIEEINRLVRFEDGCAFHDELLEEVEGDHVLYANVEKLGLKNPGSYLDLFLLLNIN